jgi:hypothetical protein
MILISQPDSSLAVVEVVAYEFATRRTGATIGSSHCCVGGHEWKSQLSASVSTVLAPKGNRGTLQRGVHGLLTYARENSFEDVVHGFCQTIKKGHKQVEVRQHWTVFEPEFVESLDPRDAWRGLRGIGTVESERRIVMKRHKEKPARCGVKTKRLKTSWSEEYLLRVFTSKSDAIAV